MALEQALTAPVTGQLILDWLYAHEQVLLFNSSWELREFFLGDILEIRAGLNAWHWLLSEALYETAIAADIDRALLREHYDQASDSS